MSQQQTIIYFTCSAAMQNSERYKQLLHLVSRHFAAASDKYEIIEGRAVFPTVTQWRKGWPAMVERLDVLIFLVDDQHTLGHGVRGTQARQESFPGPAHQ